MHLRKQLRALIAQRVTIVRVSHRCSNAQLESTIYTQTKRTTEAVFHAPLESIVLEGQCMRAVPLANTVHFLINPMKPKRVVYAKVGIFAGVVPGCVFELKKLESCSMGQCQQRYRDYGCGLVGQLGHRQLDQ